MADYLALIREVTKRYDAQEISLDQWNEEVGKIMDEAEAEAVDHEP